MSTKVSGAKCQVSGWMLVVMILSVALLTGCHSPWFAHPLGGKVENGQYQVRGVRDQEKVEVVTAEVLARDTNHFAWSARVSREDFGTMPTVKESLRVQARADLPPPLPDEDYCPTCVGAQPGNATFTFTVLGHWREWYGLERTFDDGKTWRRWVKWFNEYGVTGFEQTVTLMCDGPGNKFVRVRTWASATP